MISDVKRIAIITGTLRSGNMMIDCFLLMCILVGIFCLGFYYGYKFRKIAEEFRKIVEREIEDGNEH